MTPAQIKEARALVDRLDGYTPGPWEWWTSCSWMRLTSSGRNAREGDILLPFVNQYDRHPDMDVSKENAALIAAAPDLHANLTAALDEIERLRDALQAGYDLIEGDATGADWKRGCRVFTGQARAALKGDDQ